MKHMIRKQIIKSRQELTYEQWLQKSYDIFNHIRTLSEIHNSQNIMAFMDFKKEVYMHPLLEHILSLRKNLTIPRVKKNNPILELCNIKNLDNMKISSLGIREPLDSHTDFTKPSDIDLVIIPGVAFTKRGERLGYGGGYYDRIIPLMSKNPPIIAPAFDLQIIDSLPVENHDQKVNKIITESQIITIR